MNNNNKIKYKKSVHTPYVVVTSESLLGNLHEAAELVYEVLRDCSRILLRVSLHKVNCFCRFSSSHYLFLRCVLQQYLKCLLIMLLLTLEEKAAVLLVRTLFACLELFEVFLWMLASAVNTHLTLTTVDTHGFVLHVCQTSVHLLLLGLFDHDVADDSVLWVLLLADLQIAFLVRTSFKRLKKRNIFLTMLFRAMDSVVAFFRVLAHFNGRDRCRIHNAVTHGGYY